MIIGLQGYGGAGKSTVANYLAERHGFARRHIKFPLAKMFVSLLIDSGLGETHDQIERYVNGDLKRQPIPELGGRSPTEIQQFLGTQFGRDFIDPDLWLNIWSRWAEGHENVVQESVRFANEAARCDVIWEIRRPGFGPLNDHVSEALPARADVFIDNIGTEADLHRVIEVALGA